MEDSKNIDCEDDKKDINSLIQKLAQSKDIQSYGNNIMKNIEENLKGINAQIKNDKKTYNLLIRTYYLNEIDKIEKDLNNNNEQFNNNDKLTNETYLKLLSYLNALLNLENLYISKIDAFNSLKLQNRIINIIKTNFINKIEYA